MHTFMCDHAFVCINYVCVGAYACVCVCMCACGARMLVRPRAHVYVNTCFYNLRKDIKTCIHTLKDIAHYSCMWIMCNDENKKRTNKNIYTLVFKLA